MNALLHSSLVILVVLYTTNFTPVTCQDTNEDLRQTVAFNVSILSHHQRAPLDVFVDVFVRRVYASKALRDVFDISYTSPTFVLTSEALGTPNYEYIAELATRPMAQNFDVFTREDMVRVYANYPAIYAYSEGILTKKNAERLAIEYVNTMENNAKATVVKGDYTSKFTAITNGIDQFLKSMGDPTAPKMWKLAFYYHHQWLLTDVELHRKNHLYNDCIDKAFNVKSEEKCHCFRCQLREASKVSCNKLKILNIALNKSLYFEFLANN
ncbi:uncharacterized protein TNIN_247511 [Trichonephila inaurata madagascariensis]|uniref:Uncharacterized protein n=1 Tax=Trichonephila inaurata madagascariensis TaxID=2747483 RepID=A0A8X6WV61_9ARAC|nr:uncharacterized protein TNIN_247511 [Trichonephila inaurata madagascariensis]